MRCPVCQRRLPIGARCPRHQSEIPIDIDALEVEPDPQPVALEGFTLIRQLGRGGFSHVHEAKRVEQAEALRRERRRPSEAPFVIAAVAIKIALEPHDPRFEREAEAMRRVGPDVAATLYESGVAPDGRPFLVMELLAGEPLSS